MARPPDSKARVCDGISESAQKMGPFAYTEEITSVAPLVVGENPVGATVTVRAGPEITAERLQRMVDCQLVHYSGQGYPESERTYSPLAVRDASARVSSTGDGYAVEIRSNDRETAGEILAAAQRLQHQQSRRSAEMLTGQEGE
jgi:hypothetical protein